MVSISAAFRVGAYKAAQIYPRDVIAKFFEWDTKFKILEVYRNNPNPVIEGALVSTYSDISPLTLKKRKEKGFKLLTNELQAQKNPYR